MALGDGFTVEEQARWEQEYKDRWAEESAITAWRTQNGVFEVRDEQGVCKSSPVYTEYGGWMNSSAKVDFHRHFQGRGSRFIHYRDIEGTVNPGSDSAIIAPNWPSTAQYAIYVAWPQGANALNVKYTIKHAGSETIVYLDQITDTNSNQWNSLGIYTFNQGRSANDSITISEESVTGKATEGWGMRVYVDSFRARAV